jgi:hypothetical protein
MIATLAHAVTAIVAQAAHLLAFIPGDVMPPPAG